MRLDANNPDLDAPPHTEGSSLHTLALDQYRTFPSEDNDATTGHVATPRPTCRRLSVGVGGHDIQLHSPHPEATNHPSGLDILSSYSTPKQILNLPPLIMKAAQNLLALLAIASVPAVVAAPVPDQLVERDAEPEAEPGYGNYGSYPEPKGGYGTYGKYGDYGSYKREPAAVVMKRDAEPDYGEYGKYGDYGSYAPPVGGYASYGAYKRAVDFIKRLWS
ncbi:MAG: hypothetical protein M1840_005250 [Geoglossum simile]|nr:MAG: hypothetical protein M1840_005250 [Geoglossum simile]